MTDVVVVGAGVVGLSTAWSLQEYGATVTVIDRSSVGSGASWGNAGYISPAFVAPLPEPSLLKSAPLLAFSRASPLRLSGLPSRDLLAFLARMARHCRAEPWSASMSTLSLLCAGIMESFDRHRVGGVKFEFTRSEVLVALRSEAEGAHLLHDFDEGARYGRKVDYALVDGSCARDLEPALTEDVAHALVVNDQAFVDPSAYVQALSASFQVRGGKVLEGCTAQTIGRARGRVVARLTDGETLESDAIVLASGAWLPHLARSHGLRTRMAPGRGFSFRIEGPVIPSRPIYFPAAKVATTPLGGRLGVAGMMEFGPIGTPAKAEHAVAIAQSIRPLLRDLNFESLADIWVGSRPLTADGLPVVGESRTPGVFLAGGHGMWGMTLGPHSGHLLAQQIMTGAAPIQLAGLEPTR